MSSEKQNTFYSDMVHHLVEHFDQQSSDGSDICSEATYYAACRVVSAITEAQERAGPIPDRDELIKKIVRLAVADDLDDLEYVIEDAALFIHGPYEDPRVERVMNYVRTFENDAALRNRLERRLGREQLEASQFVLKEFAKRVQQSGPPSGQDSATEGK